ncbi:Thiol-disulfide isomerase or thioredoxin [Chitinophaga rupis]|uniref:Thiol-disulfide isomerase or thioredoxin n=1 Tax=Chitinophaga rupis TaxID=573321 RepID=A0A1H7VY73_9BACT|nr:redoxin domain-containing protein [Chitinophaga rupis]SEM13725.1 Thiol-disulfide isomerase or thioredoxin [Chitinophaga rupis]
MKRLLFVVFVCCVCNAQAQVDSLVKVIESRKDSVNALRAYLAAMGGTTDDAVAQFHTWMKKFPQSPSFPYVLGEAYYKKRERMKVIDNWLKVLQINRKFEKIDKLWPIVVKSDWDLDIAVTPNTIDSLKRVIAANPDSLLPVRQYVFVAGNEEEATVQQLEAWEKQFPRSSAIPLGMGLNLYNVESPKAKPWLLKAAELQPRNAAVWVMLHLDAERWGDQKAAHVYMGKASAAAPEDPNYAYYYIRYYEDTDPALWRTKLYELAKRFPNDERGAQGLYEVAIHTSDTAGKIKALEQLRALYDPGKFWWSGNGMSVLYDTYLEAGETGKAMELAKAMGTDGGWDLRQSLARGMERVNALLKAKKYPEALKQLAQLKAPRNSAFASELVVLKATTMHQNGQTQAAYHKLIAVESTSPDDLVRSSLTELGAALKKSNDEVEKDIWQAREKFITQAPAFELGLYTSDKKAALADYKGKVVLLTFWFPGCGPCRAEFPHFENVLKRFQGKNIAYLAVNVDPIQDDYVLPFLQGTGYSFVPLRGTAEWAAQTYKVSGQPTNFLIDGHGRIVFSDFQISENNERKLELMIASMLARG